MSFPAIRHSKLKCHKNNIKEHMEFMYELFVLSVVSNLQSVSF